MVVNEPDLSGFAEISNNLWPVPTSVNQYVNGGYFYVGTGTQVQNQYITPAAWEQMPLENGATPTGDVYAQVTTLSNLQAASGTTLMQWTAGNYSYTAPDSGITYGANITPY